MNKTTKIILITSGIIVLIAAGLWVNNWYHTRISPNTPQASTWNCPADKPIKGNAQSGIYHIPGGQYYKETKPERCFATEQDAQKAGYRKSNR